MDSHTPLIMKILTCFEQSSAEIKYDKIYIFEDGPKDISQITLSFGITEWGNMRLLVSDYCNRNGKLSDKLRPYISLIGTKSLAKDTSFIGILQEASKTDPIMQECQRDIFIKKYIAPAYKWCEANQLTLPLSKLVICDSFLQSGSILSFLRNRFSESVPVNGGDEKTWVTQYCKTRRQWLQTHSRKILNNTVYRMDFMNTQFNNNNWGLNSFPLIANGVKILS